MTVAGDMQYSEVVNGLCGLRKLELLISCRTQFHASYFSSLDCPSLFSV